MLSVFSGCNKADPKKDSLDAIAASYSANTYYDDEQKEVDKIVDDYTKKIEAAEGEEEIKKLEKEAIEKIAEIYTKDKIDGIKADGEEALALVKGKILPYQQIRELIPKVTDLLESGDYVNAEEAIAGLKALLDSTSDKIVYSYDYNGVSFDVEIAYSLEDGSPVVTCTYPNALTELGINSANREGFQISMSTICCSSVLNPQVDKMLSYVAMLFSDAFEAYCGEDAQFYIGTPEKARCEVNGNTYKFNLCTPEMKETLFSDSETYINSDGIETQRDTGDENPVNYVTILLTDPSNMNDGGDTLADNLTWIVLL